MTPAQLPDTGRRADLSGPPFGCILAFVTGYVDVVGFISLFGLFTAHVTGNFVLIGVDIAGNSTGLLAKLLALPTFAPGGSGRQTDRIAHRAGQTIGTLAVAIRRSRSAGSFHHCRTPRLSHIRSGYAGGGRRRHARRSGHGYSELTVQDVFVRPWLLQQSIAGAQRLYEEAV
ncbi:DUF1275 family protein [Cupriavidus sp. a3]|uniref:DUF1275 family protein n=1 Tax=Cupriavidus sp. a3 TaxID=3242158 RepID=UPI003D9C5AA2